MAEMANEQTKWQYAHWISFSFATAAAVKHVWCHSNGNSCTLLNYWVIRCIFIKLPFWVGYQSRTSSIQQMLHSRKVQSMLQNENKQKKTNEIKRAKRANEQKTIYDNWKVNLWGGHEVFKFRPKGLILQFYSTIKYTISIRAGWRTNF